MTRHRRRSIALALVAAVLVLAALLRGGGDATSPADPLVQIVSVRRPLAAGVRIAASDLAVRAVPSRWADPHQLTDPAAKSAVLGLADSYDRLARAAANPAIARRRELARQKQV